MIGLFILAYNVVLFITIRRILKQIREPEKTLSWILVVFFMPIFGILVYQIFGRSIKKDKYFRKEQTFYSSIGNNIKPELLPESKMSLIQLLEENKSSSISYYNKVKILAEAEQTFSDIFETMARAQDSIHLEYYIIEEGTTFNRFLQIFQERIESGVKIRLIFDGFGTSGKNRELIDELIVIGVECQEFMPFSFLNSLRFVNYRNHRKIVIIDQCIAYTGGLNISDKYLSPDKNIGIWKDTFVRIEGEAAKDFAKIFRCDWYYASGEHLQLEKTSYNQGMNKLPVQVVASGPDSEHKGIHQEYFSIITNAKNYVYLTTPYFIPTQAILTALKTVSLSGVDVKIMLPYNSDSKWLRWCMFTYLKELLAAKVNIFLYHGGFLHSKVIISDDILSSVGTANIDLRSFDANFEVNAIIYNYEICSQLKDLFFEEIKECEEVTLANFDQRADRNKFMESIARLSSPIL